MTLEHCAKNSIAIYIYSNLEAEKVTEKLYNLGYKWANNLSKDQGLFKSKVKFKNYPTNTIYLRVGKENNTLKIFACPKSNNPGFIDFSDILDFQEPLPEYVTIDYCRDNDIGIACAEKWQAKKLCQKFDELGFVWYSGQKITDSRYKFFNVDTYYLFVGNKRISVENIQHPSVTSRSIVPFNKVLDCLLINLD